MKREKREERKGELLYCQTEEEWVRVLFFWDYYYSILFRLCSFHYQTCSVLLFSLSLSRSSDYSSSRFNALSTKGGIKEWCLYIPSPHQETRPNPAHKVTHTSNGFIYESVLIKLVAPDVPCKSSVTDKINLQLYVNFASFFLVVSKHLVPLQFPIFYFLLSYWFQRE